MRNYSYTVLSRTAKSHSNRLHRKQDPASVPVRLHDANTNCRSDPVLWACRVAVCPRAEATAPPAPAQQSAVMAAVRVPPSACKTSQSTRTVRKQRHAAQGHHAHGVAERSHACFFEPAHVANILLFPTASMTQPAPRKSNALKNAWVVKSNVHGHPACPQAHHHVAQLRNRRVPGCA